MASEWTLKVLTVHALYVNHSAAVGQREQQLLQCSGAGMPPDSFTVISAPF